MPEADEEEGSSEGEGNVRAKPLVAVAGPLGPGAGQEASPDTSLHLLLGLARSAPAAEVQPVTCSRSIPESPYRF